MTIFLVVSRPLITNRMKRINQHTTYLAIINRPLLFHTLRSKFFCIDFTNVFEKLADSTILVFTEAEQTQKISDTNFQTDQTKTRVVGLYCKILYFRILCGSKAYVCMYVMYMYVLCRYMYVFIWCNHTNRKSQVR